jgi:hypothetical protein
LNLIYSEYEGTESTLSTVYRVGRVPPAERASFGASRKEEIKCLPIRKRRKKLIFQATPSGEVSF